MSSRSLTQTCPGGTLYTILPGDSYYGLAPRFGISIAALERANPTVDPRNLVIGQQICIPVPSTGPCPGGFTYTIQSGNTLYSLARQFGTVPTAIVAANPGLDPNNLRVGQSICIPARPPIPCPSGRTYVIAAGDTLYRIARRYNTTVDALLAVNPGLDPNSLTVGRIICLR